MPRLFQSNMFERETEKDFGDKWYQAGITALPHGDPGQTASIGVQPRQSGQSSGGGSRVSGGLGVPVPWGASPRPHPSLLNVSAPHRH